MKDPKEQDVAEYLGVDAGEGRWLIQSLSGATPIEVVGRLVSYPSDGLVVVWGSGDETIAEAVINTGALESAVRIEEEEEGELV